MTVRVFLDTNVLVYAQDLRHPEKRERSRALIAEVAEEGNGVISTQIMQEFFSVATRKLGVDPLAAKAVLLSFTAFDIVPVLPPIIHAAIDGMLLHRASFWDSLVLATAQAAGCRLLYSEDLNPKQAYGGIAVRNPYVSA